MRRELPQAAAPCIKEFHIWQVCFSIRLALRAAYLSSAIKDECEARVSTSISSLEEDASHISVVCSVRACICIMLLYKSGVRV